MAAQAPRAGVIRFAAHEIRGRVLLFLFMSVGIFSTSVAILAWFDLLPNPTVAAASPNVLVASSTQQIVVSPKIVTTTELPIKIYIPALSRTASIANTRAADVTSLDALLLKGAVRYPTSAKLGEDGNVVVFAHSSYLPIVGNQAYKTFNGIQKLAKGDTIFVYSAQNAYTYRVRSVAKESATNGAIDLAVSGRVLTLATCNSFGEKSDRFVVTADFVESQVIAAS